MKENIIKAILYFEVFAYPLTLEEICYSHSLESADRGQVKNALEELLEQGCLFRIKEYYLTQNQPEWVEAREEGNQRAKKYLKIAHKMGRFIAAFPYVRAVFVSGSLSKNCIAKDGDIDYFIITQPQRLWLARTLLVLFKKVFLFNSYKYFCVNYFIDEEHLEIEEKNTFTATEVVTLLPLYGSAYYDRFHQKNEWVKAYYPHFPRRSTEQVPSFRHPLLKRALEGILNTRLGEWLDIFFMRTTVSYWQKKFNTLSPEAFEVALKSRGYVSKHHPSNFQGKVLERYETLIKNFEATHQFVLAKQHEQS